MRPAYRRLRRCGGAWWAWSDSDKLIVGRGGSAGNDFWILWDQLPCVRSDGDRQFSELFTYDEEG